ncbi:DUF5018 domain-containing protein [Flagellimonas sp. HMM57]|uniref:leucine-rich repeat domain-containing protein n=1 Tax=unclassified Flagellimonas TaxID=2644544 RepID=UPI0013D800A0|nr:MULTISPECIES: leucine-rich repeat domain-containing protein [unclassified Flagellimonas]UII77798.1 DUF5018 domain-containing protein [Flagellimonas sp. HMM57]
MKKLSLLFLSLFVLAACSKDDDNNNGTDGSSDTEITSFTFLATDHEGLSEDVKATIDKGNKTIKAELPSNVDIKTLKPTITVSEGASVSPKDKAETDFSEAVTYTVTAEDGSEAKYTVTVTLGKSSAKAIASFKFLASDNDALSEDIEADIDEEDKTITIVISSETDVTALKPTITISDKAEVDPVEKVATDFTNEVTYTVTAEDGSKAEYTAATALTEREALMAFGRANPNLGWSFDPSITRWSGVGVNDEGKVRSLSFPYTSRNIAAIPPEIKYLPNLESIFIVNASLSSVPKEIGELKNLKSLTIAQTNIDAIPTEIGNLKNLTELSISDNKITEIPSSIGNLTNLETLFFGGNLITNFTEEITQLKNLTILGFGSSDMETFPEGITQMTNLTSLNITESSIESLSDEIGNLVNLTRLDLRENKIKAIPASVGSLTNLEDLILHFNQIAELPREIGNLSKLEAFLIQGNPVTTIPKEICALNIEDFQKDANQVCEQ